MPRHALLCALLVFSACQCSEDPESLNSSDAGRDADPRDADLRDADPRDRDARNGDAIILDADPRDADPSDGGPPDTGVLDLGVLDADLTPPPEGTDFLRCFCIDRTIQELCSTVNCTSGPATSIACDPLCSAHGGVFATGCLQADSHCDAPSTPGPDLLSCACADGMTEQLCADLSCFSPAQRYTLCDPACASHGGLIMTSCSDWEPSCAPSGPNKINCGCANGVTVPVCAPVDCTSGLMQDEACAPACSANGGLMSTGCFVNDPSCP